MKKWILVIKYKKIDEYYWIDTGGGVGFKNGKTGFKTLVSLKSYFKKDESFNYRFIEQKEA